MTDHHPLTETRAAELWDAHGDYTWAELTKIDQRDALAALRAAFDAGRDHERDHVDPFHDSRPWQDCTREGIRKGDLVERRPSGRLTVGGVAHHKDERGDWHTEYGYRLTNGTRWPLRRIPARTTTTEEVALPTKFGAVITDVKVAALTFPHMVFDGARWCSEGAVRGSGAILAFTLPDGTRALRDGDYPDGTPRFVKEGGQ